MCGRAYSMNRFNSKATECYSAGLKLAKDNAQVKAQATFYLRYLDLYKRIGLTRKSVVYGDSALQFKDKLDHETLADIYRKIGRAYYDLDNPKRSIEFLLKSQQISDEHKLFDKQYCSLMHYIGSVYKRMNDHKKALEYYLKQLSIAQQIKDEETAADAMVLVAFAYGTLGDKAKQLDYLNESINTLSRLDSKKKLSVAYANLATYYLSNNELKKAEEIALKALAMFIKAKNYEKIGALYKMLAKIYSVSGRHELAFKTFDSAYKYTNMVETKNLFFNTELQQDVSWAYQRQGKYKEAFEHYVKFKTMNDSLNSSENRKFIQNLAEEFQSEQKDKEIILLNKDKQLKDSELNKRESQRNYLLIVLAIVMLFFVFVYRSYVQKKKDNALISKQKEEAQRQNLIISEQKHLVEEKQKEILDSIAYAKRLQEAILPRIETIRGHIPDSFVLYRPKDIVAGDFYWMEVKGDKIFIAAADSTGHGVPGALVSVVCSNALNRAVNEFGILNTGKILDKTKELVLETFEKSGFDVKDGMDVSLVCINKHSMQIQWSGANNPLWYIGENGLTELKADKQPVGKSESTFPYTAHDIQDKKGEMYYLFTDGYADQFGGPRGKKFKYK